MTGKGWQQALQQYNWALDKVIADEGVAVARGRRRGKINQRGSGRGCLQDTESKPDSGWRRRWTGLRL